jgi:hypothetical protein
MRWLMALTLVGIMQIALPAQEKTRTVTFAKDDVGKLPKGWTAAQTGEGQASVWKVVADESAPSKKGFVLAQTAAAPKPTYSLCVLDNASYQDVNLSVAFKSVKGEVDQGGGLVWRYQDPSNYYIVRMNPLENNFRLYKVQGGKRNQLATANVKVPAGQWSTIQVVMTGNKIDCKLDGKSLFEEAVVDDTFAKAGKIGLWTKADAVTYFDDLKVSGK